ncbi:hypothetical protein ABIA24_001773 [Sinorhizobium fredii]|uniref:hypothetical protein n=1 Tax=Rhizobium fredii TaxID=380 RepID=UPI00351910A3
MNDAETGRHIEIEVEGGLFYQPSAAVSVDPLIGAIAVFRRQMALFNRQALIEEAELEALADKTYRPPLAVITAWTMPALSREGAVAALKLAEEALRDNDQALTGAMLKAAIAFLDKEI